MAAVNQQGSRAGLITTLVFSCVVAIVFIITTFFYNSELLKERAETAKAKAKITAFATEDDYASEGPWAESNVTALRKKLDVTNTATVSSMLATERDKVIQAALGNTNTDQYDVAVEKIRGAIAAAAKANDKIVDATDSLPAALEKLTAALKTEQSNAKKANAERDLAKGEVTTANDSIKQEIKKLQDQVEEAKKQVADAVAAQTKAQSDYTEMQKKATEAVTTANADAEKKIAEYLVAKQDADARAKKAEDQVKIVLAKLIRYRLDTKAHMFAAAPDGEIIRLGSNDRVYINLGSGDHLPPGLTFEVYGKGEGIPVTKSDPLSNSGLPEGKASIEVVRIGQNSTECRVVHLAPNQTISQGDPIANLVYDRNTSYHFFVYGDFDVQQNGTASPGEADIIKSLITRWGGKVDTKINIDTDFVILGREPKVPTFTQEELADAGNQDKKNRGDAAAAAYQAVITSAGDLHIPIMNQNRFLYYVGYYDQAKR